MVYFFLEFEDVHLHYNMNNFHYNMNNPLLLFKEYFICAYSNIYLGS